MFSSNANLTTPFPLPSTERKLSLASTLNGILSRLENTNLIRTLTYRCLRICSSPRLLQSALDDLKKHLSRNGYPRGIISYNMNDVVNKHRDKPKDIITVPKKRNFHCFNLSEFKVKLLLNSLNHVFPSSMVVLIPRLFSD